MVEEDLTFADFIAGIEDFGKGQWITAYSSKNGIEGLAIYSALIKNTLAKRSLEHASWDIRIGDGAPGFVSSFKNGKEITEYYRFSDDGAEPLLLSRSFHGMRPDYWEVSEEFRLYFNLYDDKSRRRLVHIDDNGDEHDAVVFSDHEIKIKTELIKKYLTARDMQLALFFDYGRKSSKSLGELGLTQEHHELKGENYIISTSVAPWSGFSDETIKSFGRALGKKLIAGDPTFKSGIFGRQDRQYIEFLIGTDDSGKPINHTCDEAKLSNYFGANPGAPHYLTPVSFRKEVLNKYYSQPEKYSVNDGHVYCGSLLSRAE